MRVTESRLAEGASHGIEGQDQRKLVGILEDFLEQHHKSIYVKRLFTKVGNTEWKLRLDFVFEDSANQTPTDLSLGTDCPRLNIVRKVIRFADLTTHLLMNVSDMSFNCFPRHRCRDTLSSRMTCPQATKRSSETRNPSPPSSASSQSQLNPSNNGSPGR